MSAPLRIACPHCDTVNRVLPERLAHGPRCGQCKQPLFTAHPMELTAANFDRQVGGDIPVLVDFWAPWCGPCLMMAPVFEQAASQLEPQMRLAKRRVPNIMKRVVRWHNFGSGREAFRSQYREYWQGERQCHGPKLVPARRVAAKIGPDFVGRLDHIRDMLCAVLRVSTNFDSQRTRVSLC